MNSPLVSVIIPVFNRRSIVGETIQSVLDQTYSNWELIVVDDISTDDTVPVVLGYAQKDTRISVMTRPDESPKGANACRNVGFVYSQGKYVKWLDSDDLLTPDALQKQVDILESGPQLKVCCGQGIFFNDKTGALEENWSRNIYSNSLFWDHIRNNVMWPVGGPLWRRDFFRVAPFDEMLKNSQEWLMHGAQLLRIKPDEISIDDKVVYLIRRGNIRMSSSRTSRYYFNQAKARILLLRLSFGTTTPISYQLELIKQTVVYGFHSLVRLFRSQG